MKSILSPKWCSYPKLKVTNETSTDPFMGPYREVIDTEAIGPNWIVVVIHYVAFLFSERDCE